MLSAMFHVKRPLAIAFGAELHGWPCLLDIEFDGEGLARAIVPRLLAPDWHRAHAQTIDDCNRWTFLLSRAGGAVNLVERLPNNPVILEAARLEAQHREGLVEAQRLLQARLARECAT